jgi:transcriptional regulator with XRE-family HTH domain
MEINPEEVNGRISLLMQKMGTNQKELAGLLGVTQPAVSKYLNGRVPPPEVLLKLARAADTTIEWILSGKNLAAAGQVAEPSAGYSGMTSMDNKVARLPLLLQKRVIALLDAMLDSLPAQKSTNK